MIEYIYFVKCPNCEDEPFHFFDEAKSFALGCLSQKPIITQTEVNRNDFGECTDSCDLGTVWSYEEMMTDDKPAISVFTRDDLKCVDCDLEFDALDNSLDYVPDNFKKPVPDGMTVDQLVEEMEENEDTVECKWCEELFDKSECRYEVDLGWLCSRCEAAIKSRGETLTFRENTYWDFLDERLDTDTSGCVETWVCFFDNQEVGRVEAATEEEALEKMQQEYPEYPYGLYDGCFWVEPFTTLTEDISTDNWEIELEYEDLTATVIVDTIPATQYDPAEAVEGEFTGYFCYTVPSEKAVDAIKHFITEEDVTELPGGIKALENDEVFEAFLDKQFDNLVDKYYDQLLEYFREDAEEAASNSEKFQETYIDYMQGLEDDHYDRMYDERRERILFGESAKANNTSFLEELEDAADYRKHLTMCPECGSNSFDSETGICIECGFN